MTSTRGACHLRAGFYAPELVGKFWKWEGIDRFSPVGKGPMVATMEFTSTIVRLPVLALVPPISEYMREPQVYAICYMCCKRTASR